jgi:hypothetical protein
MKIYPFIGYYTIHFTQKKTTLRLHWRSQFCVPSRKAHNFCYCHYIPVFGVQSCQLFAGETLLVQWFNIPILMFARYSNIPIRICSNPGGQCSHDCWLINPFKLPTSTIRPRPYWTPPRNHGLAEVLQWFTYIWNRHRTGCSILGEWDYKMCLHLSAKWNFVWSTPSSLRLNLPLKLLVGSTNTKCDLSIKNEDWISTHGDLTT